MSLYLVQHGKSYSKEIDPERKLTDEGKADVERIAAVAKEYGIVVQCIMPCIQYCRLTILNPKQ